MNYPFIKEFKLFPDKNKPTHDITNVSRSTINQQKDIYFENEDPNSATPKLPS